MYAKKWVFFFKADFLVFFRLFTVSVWSRPPGPPAVPGVLLTLWQSNDHYSWHLAMQNLKRRHCVLRTELVENIRRQVALNCMCNCVYSVHCTPPPRQCLLSFQVLAQAALQCVAGHCYNHRSVSLSVCQAQSQLQFNWTELALFSFFRLVSSSTGIVSNSATTGWICNKLET